MEKPIAIFPFSTDNLENIMGSLTERQKANIVLVHSIGVPITTSEIGRALQTMKGEVLVVIGEVSLELMLDVIEAESTIADEKSIWYKRIRRRDGLEQWYLIEFTEHSIGDMMSCVSKFQGEITLRQMGY